ncbi:helicase and polymerase-containing protein TEBICHI isoform X1 [Rosa rugosa]|uniref:helicase and polymerase-containing protein TEBICHI isoform X1 n=1 Tax=Rosa rugosa TaxID=74645 RepID=UPI002B40B85C|nr:helicase and polymerase-containing protein TEBICHI isoform X1 [Rosa rugosa]XP_062018738.1 helicase and polymerase-containing protein TEBICHI isoform X1 [Rosa rugosa]
MASGSPPPSRINQFFASKKRKPVSPAMKSGRNEKDVKTVEGSPSAKATLDSYLRTSPESYNVAKPLCKFGDSAARQDQVRRNLASEMDNSSKNECMQHRFSSELHTYASEASGANQKEIAKGLTEEGDVAAGGSSKDYSDFAGGVENVELKKFAADFLSLYCSDVQSNKSSMSELKVNGHKRHPSPSLLDEESKTFRKRHCGSDKSYEERETIRSTEKSYEAMQSACVDKNRVTIPNELLELQQTLKTCSNTPKLSLDVVDCYTPGSLIKSCVRQTPNSIRGSSFSSPGEAFWNDAIQLADGLCAQAAEATTASDSQYHGINSCNLRNAHCDEKSKEMMDEGERMGNGADSEPMVKHRKDLHKEVSPLPVKHFDFSREDKILNESMPHHIDSYNLKSTAHGGGEQSESSLIDARGLRHGITMVRCSKSQANQGQDVDSVTAVTKTKVDLSSKDNGGPTFSSPGDDVVKLNGKGESSEASTPSSFLPLQDCLGLDGWLAPEICSIYRKKGISKLYPWQVECLQVDGVLQRRNLVYCASTSAGKSFVAEILMLRQVLSSGKIALLVLPYVSLCAEKAEHLELLLEPLGKRVRSYYGNQGGGTLPKDTSVAVCTIEKANFLVNKLLEEGRLSEIGIVVIDELHMVGDPSRGYLLELLLTKLRYAAGEGISESSSGESSGMSSGKADPAHGLQIVGMSATMPNVAAVADWLQAALYQTEFRPVPLEEYIKVGNTIYNKKMEIIRTIPKAVDLGGKDPDHVVELCNEVVQDGLSVLIFCSSRKGCESTARHVSRFLKKFAVNTRTNDSDFNDVTLAIDSLRRCPAGLDPVLEETLPSGVAYHHAGLTVEEREIVETCYRKGLVRVLTATSTLAAGVNLPARRVIFRQPRIGRDFIDGTRYSQMAGRAGRTGIDTKGESVLICKPEEIKRIMGVLNESCLPLRSCLSEDMNGMTHAILEVVAGGIVQTANDIHRYVRCTLLNSTKPFQDVVKSAQESLRWLCHKKFLEWNDDNKLYNTTPLGRAAFGSSLCPEESLIVLDDLSRAREGFVLASDLHLVYLVTPINVDVEPDWELYYEQFMELSALDQSVGNRVGVTEPFLMRMAHGAPMRSSNRMRENTKALHGNYESRLGTTKSTVLPDDQTVRVCKRFYVALILSRLVQEVAINEVCEAFKVARGMVQALQENAGRFASMVTMFCERLGWHDLEGLVGKFQNRVSFGVRAEIVELTTIPFVKGSRARALYKAGLRTPLAIAETSIPEIVKALFESSSWAAQEGSAQRRIQVGVAKKIKKGAHKIVLEKAEEARVAAFSAFKSLGLEVPQFSQPLFPTAGGSPTMQGTTNSSGDENTSSFVNPHVEDAPKPSLEGRVPSDKVVSGAKLTKTSVIGTVVASGEVNSSAVMQIKFGAENSVVPIDGSGALADELNATVHQTKIADLTNSIKVDSFGDRNRISSKSLDPKKQGSCEGENLSVGVKGNACEKGPIHAIYTPGGIDSFLNIWETTSEFHFDIHYNKRSELNSVAPFEIHGMAICWEDSPVYYVNIPKDLLCSGSNSKDEGLRLTASGDRTNVLPLDDMLELAKRRWSRIGEIMGKRGVRKFTWMLKSQIQALKCPAVQIQRFGCQSLVGKSICFEIIDTSFLLLPPVHIQDGIDMCIVAWILWPDEEKNSNPNLEKEVKKRLSSDTAAAANRNGRWKNQMRRAAHNGCCRRVAQTRALCSVLWKLLVSEDLAESLINIEVPLVNILADMELWGVGLDMEGCLQARNVLGKKLRHLEKEAYKLAGMTFSLYTAADIANVLYGHLKLPIPEVRNKGKQHPSTDKHCLDLLRDEHPIIPIIKEHRTLAKLLNCTLGSICSLARLSVKTQKYTLHGHWLQTSTATGRLSMEEPNLQCVEHMVDFKMNKDEYGGKSDADHYKINAREYFIPTQDNWILLTADYSQIELRLMAHFSEDSSLIELLSKPHGDVFTMIAARWTGMSEDCISSDVRDQTKRLVYGILYGMGANSLAEQLDCSPQAASEKIQNFKSSFPGVASWLNEAVGYCRKKGYVETIKGRKRFLSKIKFGNSKEKSKAQRQAVNSICQGSAADIIKIAMINIYSIIVDGDERPDSTSPLATKFHKLKGRCRILLQVHDELVLEVDPSVIKEAALLLQTSMESAVSLLVPMHVKLKVGRTWGSLQPFQADQYEDLPDP